MSAEEFMRYGFDSDEEEETGNEEKEKHLKLRSNKKTKNLKRKAVTSESSVHKKQIDRLKEKDPEFYKFLQENDEQLLDFSGSDDDSNRKNEDQTEVDDDADNNNDDKNDDDPSFDGSDSDGEENGNDSMGSIEDDDEEQNEEDKEEEELTQSGKVVDMEMIKKWKESLQKDSVKTLKCVFNAFHASVEHLSPEDDEKLKKKSKYVVHGGTLFNSIVALCFKYSVDVLEKYLAYVKEKKVKKTHLPSSSKQWMNVKMQVKQYLMDILQLLRQLTDPTILTITLRHCQLLCPYYACFPKITKMLLKRLVRMWSSGDEHVRVLAFLCIRKLSMLVPTLFEYAMKKLYLSFVRNSKFVNMATKPTLMFMRNSLVEIFSLNETATYRHAFVYIRQLAIHLRNAIMVKKKDAHQSVYNWQFISCLQLWTQVLSELNGEVLKPLIYPVVQITLGVIRLIPAARYFPLRFQCIKSLNELSKKTGVYIPIASLVLEVVESKEFQKKPKSSEKPPEMTGVLKLSKTQLQTKGFQDVTIDMAFEALMEHYVNLANSIAFPELVFPVCRRLKHLAKVTKVFKLTKDVKVLIDKLQTHSVHVTNKRSKVVFSPKDVEEVRAWEAKQKEQKNGLSDFYDTWQKMRNLSEKNEHVEKKVVPAKRKKKNGIDEKNDKKTKPKKRKTNEGAQVSHEDDIIEDFMFTDEESDTE